METKLKFKVGDRVRVKSLEWYNANKYEDGYVEYSDSECCFSPEMSRFCGEYLTIKNKDYDCYSVEENYIGWQDWMLEDNSVTEEKQEVQLQNKNDTREKVITKKEAKMLLSNKKIACFSKEETIAVQEKLLETGFVWIDSTRKVYDDTFLIFTREDGFMYSTDNIKCWLDDCMEKIEVSEILAIQIKEEETPKFDPTTLQPFDKVLVRNRLEDHWGCSFFSHINRTMKYKYICDERPMLYCIPFNEETKHLIGTPVEEPEFYKIWE